MLSIAGNIAENYQAFLWESLNVRVLKANSGCHNIEQKTDPPFPAFTQSRSLPIFKVSTPVHMYVLPLVPYRPLECCKHSRISIWSRPLLILFPINFFRFQRIRSSSIPLSIPEIQLVMWTIFHSLLLKTLMMEIFRYTKLTDRLLKTTLCRNTGTTCV